MITLKNFATIHLRLNQIDVLKFVIVLVTYSIKYVLKKPEDLNLSMLNIITGINESKTLTKNI